LCKRYINTLKIYLTEEYIKISNVFDLGYAAFFRMANRLFQFYVLEKKYSRAEIIHIIEPYIAILISYPDIHLNTKSDNLHSHRAMFFRLMCRSYYTYPTFRTDSKIAISGYLICPFPKKLFSLSVPLKLILLA